MIKNGVLSDIEELNKIGILSDDSNILISKGYEKTLNVKSTGVVQDTSFACKTQDSIFFRFYIQENNVSKELKGSIARMIYAITFEDTGETIVVEQTGTDDGIVVCEWIKNSVIIVPPKNFTSRPATVLMEAVISDSDETIISPSVSFKIAKSQSSSDVFDKIEENIATISELTKLMDKYNNDFEKMKNTLDGLSIGAGVNVIVINGVSYQQNENREIRLPSFPTSAEINNVKNTLEGSINTVKSSIDTINTQVNDLNSKVNDLDTDINVLEGNLTSTIDNVNQGMLDNTTKLGELKTTVNQNNTTINTTLSTLQTSLGGKANTDDVYDKSRIDTLLSGLSTSFDTKLGTKANSSNVYTRSEIDISQDKQDTQLGALMLVTQATTKTVLDLVDKVDAIEAGGGSGGSNTVDLTEVINSRTDMKGVNQGSLSARLSSDYNFLNTSKLDKTGGTITSNLNVIGKLQNDSFDVMTTNTAYSKSTMDTKLAGYLPVAGGTVSSLSVTGALTAGNIDSDTLKTRYINSKDYFFRIRGQNGEGFVDFDSSNAKVVYPATDSSVSLGKDTNRFSNIYSTNATISTVVNTPKIRAIDNAVGVVIDNVAGNKGVGFYPQSDSFSPISTNNGTIGLGTNTSRWSSLFTNTINASSTANIIGDITAGGAIRSGKLTTGNTQIANSDINRIYIGNPSTPLVLESSVPLKHNTYDLLSTNTGYTKTQVDGIAGDLTELITVNSQVIGDKLDKAGGTVTGNLTVNGNLVSGSYRFVDTTYPYIQNTKNYIGFCGSNIASGFDIDFTNKVIKQFNDKSEYALGSSSSRWTNVYSIDGNFSGNVTASNLYNKTQLDTQLANKANTSHTHSEYALSANTYTKSDVYTKTEVNAIITGGGGSATLPEWLNNVDEVDKAKRNLINPDKIERGRYYFYGNPTISADWDSSEIIKVKPNTVYGFNLAQSSNLYVSYYGIYGAFITSVAVSDIVFGTPSDVYGVRLSWYNSINNPTLIEGSDVPYDGIEYIGNKVGKLTPNNTDITLAENNVSFDNIKADAFVFANNFKNNAPKRLEMPVSESTHPKVVYVKGGFNGHEYWTTFTPYYKNNGNTENVWLAHSDDGINWSCEDIANPIVNPKSGVVNSDSHLQIVNGKFEVWYRENVLSTNGEKIWRTTSTDSLNWTAPQFLHEDTLKSTAELLSPSFIYDGNKYQIWALNRSWANGTTRLDYYESTTGTNWNKIRTINIDFEDNTYVPWHFDIVKSSKGYEFVGSYQWKSSFDTRNIMCYAVSTDNVNYTVSKILESGYEGQWDGLELYRPSLVNKDSEIMLYYGANGKDGQSNRWGIGIIKAPSIDYLINTFKKDTGGSGGSTQDSYTKTEIDSKLLGKANASHTHTSTDLPTASTTAPGIVQLSNATNSSSSSMAVTPNALSTGLATKANTSHTHSEYVGTGELSNYVSTTALTTALATKANTSHSHSEYIDTPTLNTRLGGMTIWEGSKSAYDAIATKDPYTLYFVEKSPARSVS